MPDCAPCIDLDAYFARVGFAGPGAPDLATLQRLHALHAAAIPFENLSAFLGEPIALDARALQEKLVGRGRGGWCFEQNLLFSHMLGALGFGVKRLAARVRWGVPAGVVTSRSHMLMQVDVAGEPYLADVGFGGLTLTSPLRLLPGVEQATAHESHRLVAEGAALVLEARVAGEWQALYAFEPHEQQLADYEVGNWYLANHPASMFVSGVLAARAEPGQRYALRNARFAIHTPDGATQRRTLASVGEVREALAGPLRIALPSGDELDRRLAAMLEREGG